MNKILTNIRAVRGVTGVMVVDKKRALTYELSPASFTSDNIKNIALPLLHFGRSLNANMSLDFFFEKGLIRLYNRPEQVVLIFGHLELNLNALGIVCREAIPAISRKLSQGRLGVSSDTVSDPTDVGPEFLLKAINVISTHCVEKIGAYLVTKYLRQAKEELSGEYPFLSKISVDNNAVASLITGLAHESGTAALRGFAHWSNLFLSLCARGTDKLKPADIMELSIEIKDKLDLSGFYQLYADVGI